eukprot:1159972-Pelagomonas_calceolata.AAC.10
MAWLAHTFSLHVEHDECIPLKSKLHTSQPPASTRCEGNYCLCMWLLPKDANGTATCIDEL